jgi:acetoin utilization deacetylase AcuC-like enzyme
VEHRLFYCDQYAIPLPSGHKFPMAKYRMLRDLLAGDGCFRFEPAPFADPSVGGTLSATCDAFDSGWGSNLAGGTHHAFRGEGSGFCVFNDIAVSIQWLRAKGRIQRAAVIDLDVHQGDGTAQIFESDSGILTLSLHAKSNFPFRKQRSTIDVDPLASDTLGHHPIELTAGSRAYTFRATSEIFS